MNVSDQENCARSAPIWKFGPTNFPSNHYRKFASYSGRVSQYYPLEMEFSRRPREYSPCFLVSIISIWMFTWFYMYFKKILIYSYTTTPSYSISWLSNEAEHRGSTPACTSWSHKALSSLSGKRGSPMGRLTRKAIQRRCNNSGLMLALRSLWLFRFKGNKGHMNNELVTWCKLHENPVEALRSH